MGRERLDNSHVMDTRETDPVHELRSVVCLPCAQPSTAHEPIRPKQVSDNERALIRTDRFRNLSKCIAGPMRQVRNLPKCIAGPVRQPTRAGGWWNTLHCRDNCVAVTVACATHERRTSRTRTHKTVDGLTAPPWRRPRQACLVASCRQPPGPGPGRRVSQAIAWLECLADRVQWGAAMHTSEKTSHEYADLPW